MSALARRPLVRRTLAWLALAGLTLLGLVLADGVPDRRLLAVVVAAVMWLKGVLVARAFLDTGRAHPFIRRGVAIFVAIAPLALLLTAFFGPAIARWATL